MAALLDLSNLPDADVVALAQRGREDAFRELVRRYERPVVSLIFRMVRERAPAAGVEPPWCDLPAHGEPALDERESKERGSAIEKAIARLRPEYRSCILLRHVEDRSYEEIAATLDRKSTRLTS